MRCADRTLKRVLAVSAACGLLMMACSKSEGDPDEQPAPDPAAPPDLLMAHGPHVLGVRESLQRGEPRYADSLRSIQQSADRALLMEAVSVMDKDREPASGDKHDYMSQAPYWWPDPSSSDGLPYVRRDGDRNPEIDGITDRENLQTLSRAVTSLGLAYYFTGGETYAETAARFVRVWFLDEETRMTPHLEFAQGIPGVADGRSAGIIESRFLPTIIDGVTLLQGSAAWTSEDDEAFRQWMRDYLEWLTTSEKGRAQSNRGNNQETWYRVQVAALAIYLGDTETAKETIVDGKLGIGGQFELDGEQPRETARTRAWDYSIFNLMAYMHMAYLGERVGEDVWNFTNSAGRSLRSGVDYLIPFATEEEEFPHEQTTEFRASMLHPVLRWAAVGWQDPSYREVAEEIGGETPLLDLTLP